MIYCWMFELAIMTGWYTSASDYTLETVRDIGVSLGHSRINTYDYRYSFMLEED